MKRDVVITVLLIFAGIILAFVLFGAGVSGREGVHRRGQARLSARVIRLIDERKLDRLPKLIEETRAKREEFVACRG